MASSKLIILSTRLPVTVKLDKGKLKYEGSTGGLATGMASVKKSSRSIWIGWPGVPADKLTAKQKTEITNELKKRGCFPVFLTQKQLDEYYSGYCNSTIWPLFHYYPNRARFASRYWEQYQAVNKLFLKAAKQFIDKDTRVWVHDYQLMLLPSLLRNLNKQIAIGFFLHTPFPSFEIFRLFPEREKLLEGLLGADLVGFHTYDYVRHFLSSVRRILGHENSLGAIKVDDRTVQTDAFPIGIDYNWYAKKPLKQKLAKIFDSKAYISEDMKIIVSAGDRLDYTKGLPARLDAYELFLKQNPQYREKVVMIMHAAPSRTEVEEYQKLRQEIEQRISQINGQFSSVGWAPIIYIYRVLPLEEIKNLMAHANVMLVTPYRDGMNLVAKEFVAIKHRSKGVLVLSEMAGVASELTEALIVNPNNKRMVADAIKHALEMPEKEQRQRLLDMQQRISYYTVQKWAEDFMTELDNISRGRNRNSKTLTRKNIEQIKKDYKNAETRLALLDYDGTLTEFVASPKKSLARPSRKVKSVLKRLTADKKNKLIIISGRPKNTLESFFEGIGLGLVAEHGGWIFNAGNWVKSSLTSKKWKQAVKPVLQQYTLRTPGSEVEEKDFSLVWHYRQVSPDLAYVRAQALKMELQHLLSNSEVDVFQGNKIIEVKPRRMHKGAIVTELLSDQKWDFILAIGDDYTDEDLFRALPERAYTINVGTKETSARFQLETVKDVIELLNSLYK